LQGIAKSPKDEAVKPPPMVVAKADQAEIDARRAREAAQKQLADIYFAFDKWALTTEGKKNLIQSADALKQVSNVKLLIEGMQVLGTALPAAPAAAADPNAPAASGEPATTLTGNQELVILAVSAQQAEIIKFAQMDGSITLALRSPKDFVDENGQPVVNLPAGTTGVILKTLVDGYGVIRPELVEAILPTQ